MTLGSLHLIKAIKAPSGSCDVLSVVTGSSAAPAPPSLEPGHICQAEDQIIVTIGAGPQQPPDGGYFFSRPLIV